MPQPRRGALAQHARLTTGQETPRLVCTYTYPCGSGKVQIDADTSKDVTPPRSLKAEHAIAVP